MCARSIFIPSDPKRCRTLTCSRSCLACLRVVQFLADLESNPLLRDSMKCQRLLMEGMKYHLLPQRRPLLQSPRTRPRKATVGAMFAVGGMDATKGSKRCRAVNMQYVKCNCERSGIILWCVMLVCATTSRTYTHTSK